MYLLTFILSYLLTDLLTCLFIYLFTYLFTYLHIYLHIYSFIYVFIYLVILPFVASRRLAKKYCCLTDHRKSLYGGPQSLCIYSAVSLSSESKPESKQNT